MTQKFSQYGTPSRASLREGRLLAFGKFDKPTGPSDHRYDPVPGDPLLNRDPYFRPTQTFSQVIDGMQLPALESVVRAQGRGHLLPENRQSVRAQPLQAMRAQLNTQVQAYGNVRRDALVRNPYHHAIYLPPPQVNFYPTNFQGAVAPISAGYAQMYNYNPYQQQMPPPVFGYGVGPHTTANVLGAWNSPYVQRYGWRGSSYWDPAHFQQSPEGYLHDPYQHMRTESGNIRIGGDPYGPALNPHNDFFTKDTRSPYNRYLALNPNVASMHRHPRPSYNGYNAIAHVGRAALDGRGTWYNGKYTAPFNRTAGLARPDLSQYHSSNNPYIRRWAQRLEDRADKYANDPIVMGQIRRTPSDLMDRAAFQHNYIEEARTEYAGKKVLETMTVRMTGDRAQAITVVANPDDPDQKTSLVLQPFNRNSPSWDSIGLTMVKDYGIIPEIRYTAAVPGTYSHRPMSVTFKFYKPGEFVVDGKRVQVGDAAKETQKKLEDEQKKATPKGEFQMDFGKMTPRSIHIQQGRSTLTLDPKAANKANDYRVDIDGFAIVNDPPESGSYKIQCYKKGTFLVDAVEARGGSPMQQLTVTVTDGGVHVVDRGFRPPPIPGNFETPQEPALHTVDVVHPRARAFTKGEKVYCRKDDRSVVSGKVQKIENADADRKITVEFDDNTTMEKRATELWHADEVEAKDAKGAEIPFADMVQFLERKAAFLERNSTLTQQEFEALFKGDPQQDSLTGTCYIVAAFASMRRNHSFPELMRTSIRRNNARSGWDIRIPLGSGKDNWITVTDAQMASTETSTDGRRLAPVRGANGWRILEAAYTFHGPKQNRERADAEGGYGYEVFSFFFQKDTEAFSEDRTVLHYSKSPEVLLNSYTNGLDIAVAASLPALRRIGSYASQDADNKPLMIMWSHAYAIHSVDRVKKTITLTNPHNNIPFTMTWDKYHTDFSRTETHRVDYAKMFP